jgi:mannose-6-phosphate isomerase-like protein (cupin superfamily)
MNEFDPSSIPALTPIDIDRYAALENEYTNLPLALVNDHVVRVSIMTEAYFWHYHPNSDETFLGIEGVLLIELKDSIIELLPRQLFTVPKNTSHRTRPKDGRSVNLTFESRNMQTVISEEQRGTMSQSPP